MNPPSHPRPKASILRTAKAVGWSFFGIRKASAFEEDAASLSPLHVIVIGFVALLVFVGGLILLVRWAVPH